MGLQVFPSTSMFLCPDTNTCPGHSSARKWSSDVGVRHSSDTVDLDDTMDFDVGVRHLSDRMDLLSSFRKSTPPPKRQLNILTSGSKQ